MIIFLYGENDFKISQKLKELQDKFIKEIDPSGQNIFKFDGEKIKIEEISGQLGSGSLFCNKKMIIISNLIKNKQKKVLDSFLNYLEKNKINNSSDIFIIIEKNLKTKNKQGIIKINNDKESPLNKEEKEFYGYLNRQKYSQEFKNFSQVELINFIKTELLKHNLNIDNKEAQLLIALTGSNSWNIYNEIKKIINFKLTQTPNTKITLDDIEKISSGIFTENIFNFTDALSNRNINLALKTLEEQYLAGSEEDYILSMLLRQFKILLQIRELLDLNYNSQKISSSIKLHPFIISKGINQAKNFDLLIIKKIINKLLEIEKQNRQGQTNVKASINILINKI